MTQRPPGCASPRLPLSLARRARATFTAMAMLGTALSSGLVHAMGDPLGSTIGAHTNPPRLETETRQRASHSPGVSSAFIHFDGQLVNDAFIDALTSDEVVRWGAHPTQDGALWATTVDDSGTHSRHVFVDERVTERSAPGTPSFGPYRVVSLAVATTTGYAPGWGTFAPVIGNADDGFTVTSTDWFIAVERTFTLGGGKSGQTSTSVALEHVVTAVSVTSTPHDLSPPESGVQLLDSRGQVLDEWTAPLRSASGEGFIDCAAVGEEARATAIDALAEMMGAEDRLLEAVEFLLEGGLALTFGSGSLLAASGPPGDAAEWLMMFVNLESANDLRYNLAFEVAENAVAPGAEAWCELLTFEPPPGTSPPGYVPPTPGGERDPESTFRMLCGAALYLWVIENMGGQSTDIDFLDGGNSPAADDDASDEIYDGADADYEVTVTGYRETCSWVEE
ncbi:MAG: hypothetical protein K0U93_30825 [Gammaproteobacteria bacterium]|nr:hypothetical protein [Gammaproteobacteria bacterium]